MKKIAIVLLAALMLLAISCDEQPQHEHKFSEEWKSNETQHWHECECKEKSGAADHDFETITIKATCSEKGSVTEKCKVCGFVKNTKELDKLEHTPSETHIIVKSTCSEYGSDTIVCSECESIISTTYTEKAEHTVSEEKVIKAPTCTEEGLKGRECSVCHEVISPTPIPPCGHSFGVWSTPDENGQKIRQCSVCNATQTVEKPTEEIMLQAIAYDNFLGNLDKNVESITTCPDATDILAESGKLYDIQNFSIDGIKDIYSFEIKESDEANYHSYVIGFEEESMVVESIDGVLPEKGYDVNSDEYIMGFAAFMMSNDTYTIHTFIINAEYSEEQNTYIVNFDAVYDTSKELETRHLKITNTTGGSTFTALEYTMNMKGPEARALPILFMKNNLSIPISNCNAVTSFIVDGVSYDLDIVNGFLDYEGL